MNALQAILLALVQGATEFIPVSSSGHLVLLREWFRWSDEGGMYMDTTLHAASLLAILIYFEKDFTLILKGILRVGGDHGTKRRMMWLLIVATIPAIIVGPILEMNMHYLRNGLVVGICMLMAAAWFVIAERRTRSEGLSLTFRIALLMGAAQIFGLLPGASRSGVTIAAGLVCGLARPDAAKFAFLMAVPTILGATILAYVQPFGGTEVPPPFRIMVLGFVVCFLVSFASIHFCIRLFKKHSLKGFALYLAFLGAAALILHFV